MKPKVYLETTIPSYLTARPSRDLVTAAHQRITHEWWDIRRHAFDLLVSQMVLDEARAGDQEAATRRLAVLTPLPLLNPHEEEAELAQALLEHVPLPASAAADALHIAIAVVNGMDVCILHPAGEMLLPGSLSCSGEAASHRPGEGYRRPSYEHAGRYRSKIGAVWCTIALRSPPGS